MDYYLNAKNRIFMSKNVILSVLNASHAFAHVPDSCMNTEMDVSVRKHISLIHSLNFDQKHLLC